MRPVSLIEIKGVLVIFTLLIFHLVSDLNFWSGKNEGKNSFHKSGREREREKIARVEKCIVVSFAI